MRRSSRSPACTLTPNSPAMPGVFSTSDSRTSLTHSSSVSPGTMAEPPRPTLSTRTKPTASSCTAARLGGETLRLDRVHDVAVLARGVARAADATREPRSLDQRGVDAGAAIALREPATQVGLLHRRAQPVEAREVDAHLGQPRLARRARVHRRAVHVEVVLVAPELHERVELPVLPPAVPVAAHPEAQRLVRHEVLGALREAEVRLGALVEAERSTRGAGLQPQRALVDLDLRRLEPRAALVRLIASTPGGG